MIDFPTLIKTARIREQLNHSEFGNKWGVSPSLVSRWETGVSQAPYEVVEYCLSTFNISPVIPEICPTCLGSGLLGVDPEKPERITRGQMNLSDEERERRRQAALSMVRSKSIASLNLEELKTKLSEEQVKLEKAIADKKAIWVETDQMADKHERHRIRNRYDVRVRYIDEKIVKLQREIRRREVENENEPNQTQTVA